MMEDILTQGKVITFYSFKGGVGRTVTLKNTAVHLKKFGYRIAVIDMDTECPGYSLIHSENAKISFFSLLSNFFDVSQKNDIDQATHQLKVKLDKYLKTSFLELPAFISNTDEPDDKQKFDVFVNSLKKIDRSFYKVVPDFLKVLIDYLKKYYNYILIDTRTGLSEISLWNIRLFSDIIVWVLTLSEQNLKGIFYTFDKFSESIQKTAPSFVFVSNMSPPIPEWKKQRFAELFKYIHLREGNLLVFPYAPEPIYNEKFSNTPLNKDFSKVAKAILSVDPQSHLFLDRYSRIHCKFKLINERECGKECNKLKEFKGYTNLVSGIDGSRSKKKIYLISILFECLLRNSCYSLIVTHYLEKKEFILNLKLEENNNILSIYHCLFFALLKTEQFNNLFDISKKIDRYYFGYFLDDILMNNKILNSIYHINIFYENNNKINNSFLEEYLILKLIFYYKQFINKRSHHTFFMILVCWFLISNNTIAVTRYFWPPLINDKKIEMPLSIIYDFYKNHKTKSMIGKICGCLFNDIKNEVLLEDILQLIYQIVPNNRLHKDAKQISSFFE